MTSRTSEILLNVVIISICILLLPPPISTHPVRPGHARRPTKPLLKDAIIGPIRPPPNVIKPPLHPPRRPGRKAWGHRSGTFEFLATHNKIRAQYGEPPLTWSRKLARYARRYGAKIAVNCTMVHSGGPLRREPFWALRDRWTASMIVESWASEGEFYDKTKGCSLGLDECGHFTQIVWRGTKQVGCRRIQCQTKGIIGICVYDPPGNYDDESPFSSAENNLLPEMTAVTTPAAPPLKPRLPRPLTPAAAASLGQIPNKI
ncbi:hypothetical protein Nepgr_011954 [Nepenthes gracilis]|uniref:SCP domain-containing protein n=1 Tax=Nepenthes gracilis TaxID=150966 RepID=A0AAD3SF60_NEPGR|nr:hypothetical protein Nepgr_011954 [Nepenthes gracilis]